MVTEYHSVLRLNVQQCHKGVSGESRVGTKGSEQVDFSSRVTTRNCWKNIVIILEIIGSEPNPMSGRRSGVFARPLVGYPECGKSFTEGENRREIQGQIRLV